MAFAAPPVSTGRGRSGAVTGADPSASSGGGFLRVLFRVSRSRRSTNDRPGNDSGELVCDRSHSAATIMAAAPATIPGGPNDSPRAWTMANDATANRTRDATGDEEFGTMDVSTKRAGSTMTGPRPSGKSSIRVVRQAGQGSR
jgi:hypothetical protein